MSIVVEGRNFYTVTCYIIISFKASGASKVIIAEIPGTATFQTFSTIPVGSNLGTGVIDAFQEDVQHFGCTGVGAVDPKTPFTVTP